MRIFGGTILALVVAMFQVACDGSGSKSTDAGTDADTDSDTDSDTDGDTDTGDAPLLGIYSMTGSDGVWGEYTGTAELRDDGDGPYLVHLRHWTDADFEGDEIASAFTGEVTSDDEPFTFEVSLGRVGFIVEYGTETRDTDVANNAPILFEGVFTRTSSAELAGDFQPVSGPGELGFSEIWTWTSPPGDDPIWRNEREIRPGHDPVDPAELATLFATYATYHGMPEVAPYVGRPEFQDAIHHFVFDPTDYDYYQQNSGILRVIQKVVDAISLVETRQRARAYGNTLAQKRAHFEPLVPQYNLNSVGMVCGYDPTLPVGDQQTPNGDSMLWTGVYAATQAMRYMETGDPEAVDNMLLTVHGQLMCYDIAPTPGDFARTIRDHIPGDTDPDWIQGLGVYSAYDWEVGANNDMLKGFFVGFPWVFLALSQAGGHDVVLNDMQTVIEGLLDDSPLVDVSGVADIQNTSNRMIALLIYYMMNQDAGTYLEYTALYPEVSLYLTTMGGGHTYEYGISDWSGNHLGIQTMLTLLFTATHGDNVLVPLENHVLEYQEIMTTGLERMRDTRIGLLQLIYGAVGDFATAPPEVEDALWVMREMPIPKESHHVDWRINPRYCMSPFPSLPWKFDWMDGGRFQSITSYPLFERGPDMYEWKSNPMSFEAGATTTQNPGVDFLLAYWFARRFGVIDDTW